MIKDLFWILFINGFSSATITIDYIKIERDIWVEEQVEIFFSISCNALYLVDCCISDVVKHISELLNVFYAYILYI